MRTNNVQYMYHFGKIALANCASPMGASGTVTMSIFEDTI